MTNNTVSYVYITLCAGMASNKGSTAELDSVICIRTRRPERMDALKPRGTFCKVLAVVEVCKYCLESVRVWICIVCMHNSG